MTVESTTTRAVFAGNGSTRKFPLPFPLLSASHLEVYITKRDMSDSIVVSPLSGGYSVQDIATAEPYVVYPEDGEAPPLEAGWQLTAVRRLPLIQQTNLENGGNLHAETLETQFDLVAMQLQQLDYDLKRSVKVPPYSSNESIDVSEILHKMEKFCERAEHAARRVEEQADADVLADRTANLAATWLVGEEKQAGELVELPVHYMPGFNVLSLSVDGVLCYPQNSLGPLPDTQGSTAQEKTETTGEQSSHASQALPQGTQTGAMAEGVGGYGAGQNWGAVNQEGIYQYEEVPGDGPYSRIVRILFPLQKGAVCHARVMVANTAPLSEALLEQAKETVEQLEKLLDDAKKVMK